MRTIIAANWKMYKTRAEAYETASKMKELLAGSNADGREVVVFAPFTALSAVERCFKDSPIRLGAQDVYPADEGAFTGEISPGQLSDCGAEWVLVGHSERRRIIGEPAELIAKKVAFSVEKNLSVMLCIGETLEERESGRLEQVLRTQIETGTADVSENCIENLAVAYEPVWAIGTGRVASDADIIEAHSIVRRLLSTRFGSPAAGIPILYGGSVKPDNASSILTLDNVNGLLVGGASLKAESFEAIVRA